MRKTIKITIITGLIACSACVALADEQPVNCQAGQKKVAFADGNNITEVCVDTSDMDSTVQNPEVPVGQDPNNTDGHTES